MEIGKHIKKFRNALGLSQDLLAEKVYVSRQTISNWENDKNYPDLKSLLLLSTLFNCSLDTLVKGDIEEMKEKVKIEGTESFKKDSKIFSILLICMIVLPVPLALLFKIVGLIVWGVLSSFGVYFAIRVEKHKKNLDIQTYKEIISYTLGDELSRDQKNQEIGKRSYQKILLVLATAFITVIIGVIMFFIFK